MATPHALLLGQDDDEEKKRDYGASDWGAFRLQFHRAATDNDNGGYSAQWKAVGIDVAPPEPDKYDVTWGENAQGFQVCSKFEYRPQVDSALVPLIEKINSFINDGTKTELEFPDLERRERAFVHNLAAANRLAHENKEEGDKIVRVWKPKMHLCTTHHVAQGISLAPESDGSSENNGTIVQKPDSKSMEEKGNCETAGALIKCEVRWTLDGHGRLRARCRADFPRDWPCLPRVGCGVALGPGMTAGGGGGGVAWLGRGPHENYPDRKESALFGYYSSSIEDQLVNYIKPSENGNKTDTRWAAVINEMTNDALLVTASAPPSRAAGSQSDVWQLAGNTFDFSALPFSPEALHAARHTCDLPPAAAAAAARGGAHLNLDHRLMGVGGDDSWTACVHPEYLIPADKYEFEFVFQGVTVSNLASAQKELQAAINLMKQGE